jgi:hypothetical protein
MDAKELRIGNLIMWEGNHHKISSINSNGFVSITKKNLEPSRFLIQKTKPIKLTEEWLVKFGFEIDWIISHKDEYFNLFQESENYYYSADMHHYTSVKMMHVHQLQNLYFALTGEELIIKII